MIRKFCFTAMLVIIALSGFSQINITTQPLYEKQNDFNFTNEWQYLSTDLYLFNSNQFSHLLTKISEQQNSGFSLFGLFNSPERINYVFVSANIENLKFFGGDLTYPIYNFKVQRDDKGTITSLQGMTNESVRIIDNLPLTGKRDYVEATIEGKAITEKSGQEIFSVVSDQLLKISSVTNPSSAVMSLVGEFGNFMQKKQQDKTYRFNSTIRLYEEQDFNKQLHSVKVFGFMPSNQAEIDNDFRKLDAYVKKDSGRVTRNQLKELINFDTYPLMVVVNYKSRYITEPVVGDEINFDKIDERKQKKREAYQDGLINRETFIQEKNLIQFLEIFAQLKLDINNYKLNYKNEVTEDFSRNYFLIIQRYRELKKTYKSRLEEFSGNPLFENEFKKQYKSVLNDASLYLGKNYQLKDVKALVNTMFQLKNTRPSEITNKQREEYLNILYSVQIPESEKSSYEAKQIRECINDIERYHYRTVFNPKVQKLNTLTASNKNLPYRDTVKSMLEQTNCRFCKERTKNAIAAFNQRHEEYKIEKLKKTTNTFIQSVKDSLYTIMKNESCIVRNFEKEYAADSIEMPEHVKMLKTDFDKQKQQRKAIGTSLDTLDARVSKQIEVDSIEAIKNQRTRILRELQNLYNKQNALCEKIPRICECNDN